MAQKEITEFQQITTVVSDDELLIFDKNVGTTKKATAEQILAEPSAHAADTANPHAVTNSQVGLGNVTDDEQLKRSANLSDIPDPATARTNLGVASSGDMSAHIADTGNPHAVTKSQVGLGNVSNDAQLAIANNLSDVNDAAVARGNIGAAPDTHLTDIGNPHAVTKDQVGLGNLSNDAQLKIASNLADLGDPAAARTNLDVPSNANLSAHETDTANPHAVTKDQVGLGNVSNDAQLVAANNFSDVPNPATARTNIGASSDSALTAHTGDMNNPHAVDNKDVGLEFVTNDAQLKIASDLADLNDPVAARNNIGLGNVSNDAQLAIANNLSDVNDADISRDNLGVKHTLSWYIDGALAVAVEQGGVFIAPRALVIEKVYIYCKAPGSAGTTIVDIHKNGTTIFTTQANRPQLAWDDLDQKAVSGAPDVTTLVEGDIVSIDIDQIATGPSDLSAVIICH